MFTKSWWQGGHSVNTRNKMRKKYTKKRVGKTIKLCHQGGIEGKLPAVWGVGARCLKPT